MAAILEMPQYVAYHKNVAYAFIKLSAKSHSFNILCTMDVLSCPTSKEICEKEAQGIYAGTVITSFNHVMIPTRGNWFQTNPLEHESDDRADLLCRFYMYLSWHFSGKFDQHLSLYCGSVKPKFKTGPGYWFL